jgi:hypothetical protein
MPSSSVYGSRTVKPWAATSSETVTTTYTQTFGSIARSLVSGTTTTATKTYSATYGSIAAPAPITTTAAAKTYKSTYSSTAAPSSATTTAAPSTYTYGSAAAPVSPTTTAAPATYKTTYGSAAAPVSAAMTVASSTYRTTFDSTAASLAAPTTATTTMYIATKPACKKCYSNSDCSGGYSCVTSRKHDRVCKKVVPPGGSCDGKSCIRCTYGYICWQGECALPESTKSQTPTPVSTYKSSSYPVQYNVALCGDCSKDKICAGGLHCARNRWRSQCIKLAHAWERCNPDQCTLCGAGKCNLYVKRCSSW